MDLASVWIINPVAVVCHTTHFSENKSSVSVKLTPVAMMTRLPGHVVALNSVLLRIRAGRTCNISNLRNLSIESVLILLRSVEKNTGAVSDGSSEVRLKPPGIC